MIKRDARKIKKITNFKKRSKNFFKKFSNKRIVKRAGCYSGFYKPINPQKYLGDINNIIFRSLWERKVFHYLDNNKNIKKWGSEILKVQYTHPFKRTINNYYIDIFFITLNNKKYAIEIKPHFLTEPPRKPSEEELLKSSKKLLVYRATLNEFILNSAKWEAAKKYCQRNNIIFDVWTEKHLKQLGIPV